MIPGTGPDRGVPWWRRPTLLSIWRYRGQPEPVGRPREGCTIHRVPRG